jgi:predicted 3-demethylubiquinone-9 3-methyltransferase (glyoxalase superfamily)
LSLIRPVTPHLWFDTQAGETVEYYCSGVSWQIVPVALDAAMTSGDEAKPSPPL